MQQLSALSNLLHFYSLLLATAHQHNFLKILHEKTPIENQTKSKGHVELIREPNGMFWLIKIALILLLSWLLLCFPFTALNKMFLVVLLANE